MKAALIYPEWREAIKSLNPEDRGELLDLILDYANDDEVEPSSPTVAAAWGFVKLSLDKNAVKYEELCAKRVAASKKAVEAKKTKRNQTQPNVTKRNQTLPISDIRYQISDKKLSNESAFHAPAREEVEKFFLENSATIEQAERFYNYWEAAGWIRGTTPLKAWQPSARQWILEDYRKQSQQPKNQNNGRNKGTTGGEIAAAEDYTDKF